MQLPALPLDSIKEGLSAKVVARGPLNAPTTVGLVLSYTEPEAKGRRAPKDTSTIGGAGGRHPGRAPAPRAGARPGQGGRGPPGGGRDHPAGGAAGVVPRGAHPVRAEASPLRRPPSSPDQPPRPGETGAGEEAGRGRARPAGTGRRLDRRPDPRRRRGRPAGALGWPGARPRHPSLHGGSLRRRPGGRPHPRRRHRRRRRVGPRRRRLHHRHRHRVRDRALRPEHAPGPAPPRPRVGSRGPAVPGRWTSTPTSRSEHRSEHLTTPTAKGTPPMTIWPKLLKGGLVQVDPASGPCSA